MASSRSRQRKLARARYDRQMARRAAAARRKRQVQAGIGASLALVLIVVGGVWLFGGFDGEKESAAATPDTCVWNPQDPSTNDKLQDVGTPSVNPPTSGTANMMVSTNQGVVYAALDVAKAPCSTASLTYLADNGFYGNTECHELLTGDTGIYALRCGDPSGTGIGGPTYTFSSENVPAVPDPDADATPTATASAAADAVASPSASAAPEALYPKGTVAIATDAAGANGSQFYIFYRDSTPDNPVYSTVGTVTSGLDVVEKIAKAGTVDNGSGVKTKPKLGVKIQNLTVTGPGESTDSPTTDATASVSAPPPAGTTPTVSGTTPAVDGSPSPNS